MDRGFLRVGCLDRESSSGGAAQLFLLAQTRKLPARILEVCHATACTTSYRDGVQVEVESMMRFEFAWPGLVRKFCVGAGHRRRRAQRMGSDDFAFAPD